jgi:hypothetical protein
LRDRIKPILDHGFRLQFVDMHFSFLVFSSGQLRGHKVRSSVLVHLRPACPDSRVGLYDRRGSFQSCRLSLVRAYANGWENSTTFSMWRCTPLALDKRYPALSLRLSWIDLRLCESTRSKGTDLCFQTVLGPFPSRWQ